MKDEQKLNYQLYYQNKIGSAKLNIKSAVAGKFTNLVLTYTAGKLGIVDKGSIKILWRISTDIPDVQFNNSRKPNYVKLSSDNEEVNLFGYSRTNGAVGKIYERPWTNGFTVYLKNGFLSEGDKIFIKFKNLRMQTYLEKTFEFRVMVDPFNVGKYIALSDSPTLEILPDKPTQLKIIAPTRVVKGKKFQFLIKLEDQWGNPCTNVDGEFVLENYQDFGLKQETVHFREGKAIAESKASVSGTTIFIHVSYKSLYVQSNPITSTHKEAMTFWADLHWQSEEGAGTNSLEDNLNFAKDYALIDVTSSQANDFQVSQDFWEETQSLSQKFTTDGKFLVFLGYEWSGQREKGGDRNVIYLHDNNPIYRASHALITDFSDIHSDCPTVEELFIKLKSHQALTIAHVGGRASDLNKHDEEIERLVEVHSDWGTFEWFWFKALEREYKVGVVAGSDNHNGRVGASYPGLEEFDCQGGLTAIVASQLDKDTIYKALYNRHCYATTGVRMDIEVSCLYLLNHKKWQAKIGDELPDYSHPQVIHALCKGCSSIEKVEVYNKSKVLHTFYNHVEQDSCYIKVVWKGGAKTGENRILDWNPRIFPWKIKLIFCENEIKKIEKLNIFHQTQIEKSGQDINISSWTTGNSQGLIIKLAKNTGLCEMKINGQRYQINLAKVTRIPLMFPIQGADGEFEILKTTPKTDPGEFNLSYKLKNSDFCKHNAFWLKVTQRDGHMAWTSPFFFDLPSHKNVLR